MSWKGRQLLAIAISVVVQAIPALGGTPGRVTLKNDTGAPAMVALCAGRNCAGSISETRTTISAGGSFRVNLNTDGPATDYSVNAPGMVQQRCLHITPESLPRGGIVLLSSAGSCDGLDSLAESSQAIQGLAVYEGILAAFACLAVGGYGLVRRRRRKRIS